MITNNLSKISTSEEALAIAGLNWEVGVYPIVSPVNRVKHPTRYMTVREDTGEPLGIVSKRYRVLQNRKAFQFMDDLTGDPNGPKYVGAGCLYNGRKVFLVVDAGGMGIIQDDEVRKYILLVHSHDGTMAVQTILTPYRMKCLNQLTMIRNEAETAAGSYEGKGGLIYRVRHAGNCELNVEKAMEVLGIINRRFDQTLDAYMQLSRAEPTREQVEQVLMKLFPDSQHSSKAKVKREKVLELACAGRGNDEAGVRGTAWSLYNGVTEYVDHYQYPNAHRPGQHGDSARESVMMGRGAILKARALNVITNICLN